LKPLLLARARLSHLPLDEICASIQRNVLALADAETDEEETAPTESKPRRAKLNQHPRVARQKLPATGVVLNRDAKPVGDVSDAD
jgi:hypothetical protein